MSLQRWIVVALAVLTVSAAPVPADAGDSILRFGVYHFNSTGSSLSGMDTVTIDTGDGVVDGTVTAGIEADTGTGISVDYEFMITDTLGFNAGLAFVEPDVDVGFSGPVTFTPSDPMQPVESGSVDAAIGAEVQTIPITAGVNFHLVQKEKIDFYVGPVVGYVLFDDLELGSARATLELSGMTETVTGNVGESLEVDDEFAWGAVAGADIGIGSGKWQFVVRASYLTFDADDLEIDPLTLEAGLGVRF